MAEISVEEKWLWKGPDVDVPVVDWGTRELVVPEGYDPKFEDFVRGTKKPEDIEEIEEADYLKGNEKGELTRKDVLNNKKFIGSARRFLREREPGIYDTNEEVFDAFMNHFRHQDVNELTAIHDLEYAQDADLRGKQDRSITSSRSRRVCIKLFQMRC